MPKSSEKPTKAGFVRSLSPKLKAKEVIELGAKQGYEITPNDVYAARAYKAKQNEAGKTVTAKRGGRRKAAAAAPAAVLKDVVNPRATATNGSASGDKALREIILRVGLDTAERVFSELRAL